MERKVQEAKIENHEEKEESGKKQSKKSFKKRLTTLSKGRSLYFSSIQINLLTKNRNQQRNYYSYRIFIKFYKQRNNK